MFWTIPPLRLVVRLRLIETLYHYAVTFMKLYSVYYNGVQSKSSSATSEYDLVNSQYNV